MRMFKAMILAVSLSAVAVSSTAGCVMVVNVSIVQNILDKLVALVRDYTKRVEGAGSKEELKELFAALESDLAGFAEKNAVEIAAFDNRLTAEQKGAYKAELDKAVKQFEKALEKRAMQLTAE